MKKDGKHLPSAVLYGIFAAMAAAFIFCTVVAARWVDFRDPVAAVNLFLSVATLLFTLLLYVFCVNSFTWDPREKDLFTAMIVCFYLTNLPLLMTSGSEGKPQLYRLTMLLYTLLYLFSALYWLFFWFFQRGKYPHLVGDALIQNVFFVFHGVYAVSAVVNHFTGFCFFVRPDGTFVIRSLFLYILTVLWFLIYLVIALLKRCSVKVKLTLAGYSVFPLMVWVPVFCFPHGDFYRDIFSNLGMLFYLIPLYMLFFNVYLEAGHLFMQQEKELEESRARAMTLKISPHFISNIMSSIVALCYSNVQKAGDLATKFARYLRDNYTDMTEETMIPFSQELEHIRNYLAVEQVRFAGLRVEYDVPVQHFLVPTLTVQPLVENAVRHGISKRSDASGTVRISSFETQNDYVICIADDGVGYHPAPENDGKKHVGIANAKTRLTLLCAGELTVTEQPGQGTVCEIRIPKEV